MGFGSALLRLASSELMAERVSYSSGAAGPLSEVGSSVAGLVSRWTPSLPLRRGLLLSEPLGVDTGWGLEEGSVTAVAGFVVAGVCSRAAGSLVDSRESVEHLADGWTETVHQLTRLGQFFHEVSLPREREVHSSPSFLLIQGASGEYCCRSLAMLEKAARYAMGGS